MIKKIHIQNFKSVVDLELELGNINVLIGENGAGKTNILEAIILGSSQDFIIKQKLFLKGARIHKDELLFSLFNQNNIENINVFFSNENEQRLKCSFSKDEYEIFGFDEKGEKRYYTFGASDLQRFETLLNKSQSPRIEIGTDVFNFSEKLKSFIAYAPENYFLRRFEEEGQIEPLGVRGEGLFKHLVDIYRQKPELLTKISENLRLISWFKDFEIPQDLMFTERRINIKDKYLQELDFFDQKSANEGFLYLLFYFTLFISPFTPPFFAIDNIDNALNPKLCAELIKRLAVLAKENNKQVLLTTHNPAILDGLDLEDENQKLFTVYRNQEGHTKVKNIKPLKKVEGVESVRLSEAFIRGYLGGLPKNF